MSRSGYSDDWGNDAEANWRMIRWRGAVASAIKGKRGQAFLKEMLDALDSLHSKRLITKRLIRNGEVCALGAVGVARRKDMRNLDVEDHESIAHEFGISDALASEIMYMNDEIYSETPERRYLRIRSWVKSEIK